MTVTSDLIDHLAAEADWMTELVASLSRDRDTGDIAPPDLVQLLGATATVARSASMLAAELADQLTTIAQQASGIDM